MVSEHDFNYEYALSCQTCRVLLLNCLESQSLKKALLECMRKVWQNLLKEGKCMHYILLLFYPHFDPFYRNFDPFHPHFIPLNLHFDPFSFLLDPFYPYFLPFNPHFHPFLPSDMIPSFHFTLFLTVYPNFNSFYPLFNQFTLILIHFPSLRSILFQSVIFG